MDNYIIELLASYLDTATYPGLFDWTLLLLPLLVVVPLIFYYLVLVPLTVIKDLL